MPSEDSDADPNWDPVLLAQPESKRAKMSGASSVSSEGSIPTSQGSDIPWNSLDIAKAGMLLKANSDKVFFHDEDEMRRVFTLLYDVFRYKIILNEALLETGFIQKYPKYNQEISLVWLLFYDLHKRRFLPREHADAIVCCEAFDQIGLSQIERDLWNSRVKLAASLARNRIKNNALRLNQLLPLHLRDEKLVSIDDTPVTGWINTFKTSKKEVCETIENLGLKIQSKHETVLTKSDFRFDHLCPKFLLCHPIQRADLAQSPLVKKHSIILQDRAFCIGPAMLNKVLNEIPLRGTIAQTHVNSPRTTAYLANLLVENDRLEKVVAFGAGDRLLEYQTYLHDLGVHNCEVYAQRFADIHPEATILENLVAVLATPPNSYTGVTDPVDLICSRGGDMGMLKALTQTEMGEDTFGFLEEQKQTLKFCMALPQVQIILYETHSVAPEENYGMVSNIIEVMNDWARDKHMEEHRIIQEHEEAEERMNKPQGQPAGPATREQREREALEAQEALAFPREIEVPPCDLFEIVQLPELCPHGGECLEDEGCYLARIQRKEIISLDAKYMIKIAEARGLFGVDVGQKKSSTARAQKKREDMVQNRSSSGSAHLKSRKIKLEIERITAPTQASMQRSRKDETNEFFDPTCPRHQLHTEESLNKGDADSPRSIDGRRNSRDVRSQQISVQRLSQPFRRSINGADFLTEIRPSFWRYATAKSVEDLLRALRRRRRGQRPFRLDDYLYKNQEQNENQEPIEMSSHDTSSLYVNFFGKAEKSNSDESKKVKPLGGSFSRKPGTSMIKKSSLNSTLTTRSSIMCREREKCKILKQCYDTASFVFKKVDEAIQQHKKVLNEKIEDERSLKKSEIKRLQALVREEEIANIVNFNKGNRKADLILPAKYLPGCRENYAQVLKTKLQRCQRKYKSLELSRSEERELIKRLISTDNKKKYEKLTQSYQVLSIQPRFSSN